VNFRHIKYHITSIPARKINVLQIQYLFLTESTV